MQTTSTSQAKQASQAEPNNAGILRSTHVTAISSNGPGDANGRKQNGTHAWSRSHSLPRRAMRPQSDAFKGGGHKMQDQKPVHMPWQHGSTPGTSRDGPPNANVTNGMFGLHHLLLDFHVES